MLPAGPLMIEHRLIERMIAELEKEKRRIEGGGSLDIRFLWEAVDFMRTYADRCHHGKEEDILFVVLKDKAMSPPMRQAMQRLIEEHAIARGLVKRLDQLSRQPLGDAATSREVAHVLGELVALYPDHIRREDKEFFPTAMTYLEPAESERMLKQFEDLETKLLHDKYRDLVEEVEKR